MPMGLGPSTYSAAMTVGTTTVVAAPALLNALILTPASAAATLTVYDNASAGSGNIVSSLQAVANGASVQFQFSEAPTQALKGLTCVVTGAGATAQIYYQPTSL